MPRGRSCIGQKAGLVHTTWVGYNFSSDIIRGWEYRQLTSIVLAAEAAWNGGAAVDYDPGEVFDWLWHGPPPVVPKRSGFAVSLKSLDNASSRLWGTEKELLVPAPLLDRASQLSRGEHKLKSIRFLMDGAVLLAGKRNPEGNWPGQLQLQLQLHLGRPASQLQFLWGTIRPVNRAEEVGTLNIVYANGQVDTSVAPLLWRGALGRAPVWLRHYPWNNPHPD